MKIVLIPLKNFHNEAETSKQGKYDSAPKAPIRPQSYYVTRTKHAITTTTCPQQLEMCMSLSPISPLKSKMMISASDGPSPSHHHQHDRNVNNMINILSPIRNSSIAQVA